MMEISALARELSGIEKIIDTLLNLDSRIRDALWRRSARTIIARLRDLYFHENGTLGLLRRVAKGDSVPADILAETRSHFFSSEAIVTAALNDLREKCAFNNIQLTIDEVHLVQQIIDGKTHVRELVRQVYHALETGNLSKELRDDAHELCKSIEGMNAKFRDAESRFRKDI